MPEDAAYARDKSVCDWPPEGMKIPKVNTSSLPSGLFFIITQAPTSHFLSSCIARLPWGEPEAMAAAPSHPVRALLNELTCTVCLEGFRDPVMIIGCGHNFCRPCITQYWRGAFRNVACPQCWTTFSKAKLKPNRQLKNVVELTRDLSLQTPRDPPASPPSSSSSSSSSLSEDLCPLHQKPLKLFCQKDGIPLCVSCRGAEDHRDHKVLPIEEAVQEQKHLIQSRLESLKKQKDICERSKERAKKTIRTMQNVDLEKQTVVAEIEQFCQFLKNEVEFLLSHLEVLQTDISKKDKEISGKRTGQINQLNDFICDIEKTCEKPGVKLLKEVTRLNGLLSKGEILCSNMKIEDCQEYQTTYSYFHCTERYLENSLGDLENKFDQFVSINEGMMEMLPRFRAEMTSVLEDMKNEALKPHEKVCLILDCDTANKFLILSEDEKSATFTVGTKRKVPSHPKRFDKVPCVLGAEGFTRGRLYWDVDVEKGKTWAVGIARESVYRKRRVNFDPENGIWAIGFDERYVAYTGSESTPLSLSKPLKTIRVNLDYIAGEVSFYNADGHTLIFTFPPAKFSGEEIYPWFWVFDGCLRLCWSEEENYPDMDYFVSTGIIKPWEIHEYIGQF